MVAEYMSGVPKEKRKQAIALLRAYPLLNIDLEVAAEAGMFRFKQARPGIAISISVPDAL